MADCEKCHGPAPIKGKVGVCPPKVIQINNPQGPTLFHCVTVPASMGDDTTYPPKPGMYKNILLYYEANDQVYLYSSDGIPTRITINVDELKKQVAELQEGLEDETEARSDADQEIWTEIETIEASSDVVDVVGTYAELQAYDTSKLHDNDLIKVLQDETRDDAITYYRWNDTTDTFSYVGAEGPYYTASETDVLLSGKQDTLIAGTNIQIAADGKTISATDTTYTHFTGATALADGTQGLVPGPLAGDQDKVLKGDGTWGDAAANTIFYMNSSESGGTRHIYKNPDMTGAATSQEVFDANERGQVILRISTSVTPDQYSDAYLQNAYKATGDYQLLFLDEKTYRSFDTTTLSADTFTYSARVLQDQLTAGTNITISGHTISATDTTYTAGDGIDITSNTIKSTNTGTLTFDTPSAGYFTIAKDAIDYYTAAEIYDIVNTKKQSLLITFSNNNVLARVIGSTPIVNNYYTVYVLAETTLYELVYDMTNPQSTTSGTYDEVNLKESVMTGATSQLAGTSGLVPAPTTSDPDKFLKGDGTWATITVPVLYTTQGQNEDGAVTQKLFTDTVGNIEAALQILNSGAGVP